METDSHTVHEQQAVLRPTAPLPLPVQHLSFRLATVRLTVFMLGLLIMSFGIMAVVKANFGVSPWDVLHLGIVYHTHLSFGRVQQLVGVLIIAMACLLMKKWPTIGSIANMILVGEFCDFIMDYHLLPDWQSPVARILLFMMGMLVWGVGTGIYIESKLGAGPRDWLMLALHEKTEVAIRWVRTGLELFAVGFGIWLGGPFAIGTIVFSLTIGHITEYGLRLAHFVFGRYTSP